MCRTVCYNENMKQTGWLKCFILALLGTLLLGCARDAASFAAQTPADAPESAVLSTVAPAAEFVAFTIPPAATERPTPIPTPTEVPTPEPTPTPSPTPEPTPTPVPIQFVASENFPLPTMGTQIQKSRPFWVNGTVISDAPLLRVWAAVIGSDGKIVQSPEILFKASQNITEYHLLDLTFSKSIQCLAENIKFQNLALDTYTLQLFAEDSAGNTLLIAETQFRISNERWLQLQPNNLRGNYTTALAFFGSPDRFLFRYRTTDTTAITVDPDWRAQFDAEALGVNGKTWRCHIDAVPYFEQAARYIDNTYIHISGKKLDTGAVRLADILTFNGTIVRRFTNSNQFVSHHSLGTAVDINAYYSSNRDVLENRAKIYKEVTEHLTYNGIVTVDGHLCYDFTYTGTARAGLCKVPEPLMNYLLYELGFFRAGFSWGVYYPHTSDAMHFTLSELSPSLFTDGEFAMRKVFSYIEDESSDGTLSDAAAIATPAPKEKASESPADSAGPADADPVPSATPAVAGPASAPQTKPPEPTASPTTSFETELDIP